ncbi:hypothetical protein PanWU01x14_160520 [Parasponia andersonii]|uniref:Uncharacterized protein n=1 Tax=Parasponia andersonii TaxID=3476 RepID=A0A2P5CE07_PARAD|nr:hypothetical protein PanWU01x14_160520 [Parasponia andersonii]
MENQTMVSKKPYLGIFCMIKSAIGVPLRSSKFIVFTFLASLPHFSATLLETHSIFPHFTFLEALTQLDL